MPCVNQFIFESEEQFNANEAFSELNEAFSEVDEAKDKNSSYCSNEVIFNDLLA